MALIDVALAVLVLVFLGGLIRVAVGPSLADRAVAADLCLFTIVGSLALLSVRTGAFQFVDAVLVSTLLGFTAAVGLARLIYRGPRP
jgi:multicomponent Na+:H+ antiporter subunit F